MKIQPLGDKILVQQEKAQDKTPGGILLPDVAKEKPLRGRIVALGTGGLTPDGTKIPFNVEEGDVVLYNKYAGEKLPDNDELLILRESDILAKVVK